jgi:hypothetical protein
MSHWHLHFAAPPNKHPDRNRSLFGCRLDTGIVQIQPVTKQRRPGDGSVVIP